MPASTGPSAANSEEISGVGVGVGHPGPHLAADPPRGRPALGGLAPLVDVAQLVVGLAQERQGRRQAPEAIPVPGRAVEVGQRTVGGEAIGIGGDGGVVQGDRPGRELGPRLLVEGGHQRLALAVVGVDCVGRLERLDGDPGVLGEA